MTSIQAQQDRQDAAHMLPRSPLQADAACDECGRCDEPARACTRQVPVLLMTRGAIESLRAVEMKAMALSPDDVRCMVDTGSTEDTDTVDEPRAGEIARQLALSF